MEIRGVTCLGFQGHELVVRSAADAVVNSKGVVGVVPKLQRFRHIARLFHQRTQAKRPRKSIQRFQLVIVARFWRPSTQHVTGTHSRLPTTNASIR
jgi:hypothetical protein